MVAEAAVAEAADFEAALVEAAADVVLEVCAGLIVSICLIYCN